MLNMRDYDEIIYRNRAFVNMELIERPLLGTHIGSEMPLELYRKASEMLSSSKGSKIVPEAINPRDFLDDYDRLFLEYEEVGDDLFWSASPLVGFPWMEAIVGIPVYSSSETYWTTSYLDSWDKLNEITFSLENKWFQKLLEFKEVLIEHIKGRYPLATSFVPVRGIGDMMGAALGQQNLALELYDNLKNVKKLASIYADIWIKVAKIQINRTPEFHNGYIIPWYNIWMSGYCQYIQEDSLAYFSPKFYREILLKNHIKMVNNFEYSFMHLHTDGLYCLNDLYKIENLKIIEVTRDITGPSMLELFPTLKEIQKHKPLLIWGDLTREEIRGLLNTLSPRGLCICPVVKTLEEGKDLIKRMKEKNL